MRTLFIFLMTAIIVWQGHAQDFCGHIKYKYTYLKTKTGKNITKKTKDVKTEDVYICGNKFKTYFDGTLENIYIGDSVTYLQSATENTFGYIRADSAYGQDTPVYIHNTEPVTYNGKPYKTITSGPEGDKITYYYNDAVRIDPEAFRDFKLYHWNAFFKATQGGVRLISIYIDPELTIISEAVAVEKQALNDEDFKLPEGYTAQPYQSMNVEN